MPCRVIIVCVTNDNFHIPLLFLIYWSFQLQMTQPHSVLISAPDILAPQGSRGAVLCLSGIRSGWQQIRLIILNVPIASSTFSLLLGDLKAIPGRMRCIIPPVSSGASPSRTCRSISKKRCPGGILIRCMNNFSSRLLLLGAEALLCIHDVFFSVTTPSLQPREGWNMDWIVSVAFYLRALVNSVSIYIYIYIILSIYLCI